ncbi:MAG: alpha/beta hydrolase [Myxococcales bacterium]|nr:alpha/beta hydrolase [Myxococcales bacterium]
MSFVDLPAPHGRLEGLLWKVESPRAAAVVCHPHPLYGGTMHNHVTYRLAQALRQAGVSALRFNFRGVGRSSGVHDHGMGEVDDAASALEWLSREVPGVPLFAAGFSFGARVALELALREARIERLLAAGLAVDLFDFGFLRRLDKPVAFIQGDRDEYGALPKVEALVASLAGSKRLFVVADCDHLATGRQEEFLAVAKKAVSWLLAQPEAPPPS